MRDNNVTDSETQIRNLQHENSQLRERMRLVEFRCTAIERVNRVLTSLNWRPRPGRCNAD